MAVRKFFLCIGQSNAASTATMASYLTAHPELSLLTSLDFAIGSYQQTVTLPGTWPGWANATAPGYTASTSLSGMAIEPLKFLTPYNPLATGYGNYPGTARVVASGSTTTSIKTNVRYASSAVSMTITRKLTNTTHTVTATATSGFEGVLTLSGATPFTSTPLDGEEIQIQLKATSAVTPGGTTVDFHPTWGSQFGPASAWRASMTGLELRYLGPAHPGRIGDRKKITNVAANGTTITFESAWTQDPHANDLFEIVPPQVGGVDVPIHKWAYWLPWSAWEGEASGSIFQPAPKKNPYPPGFNYPQHYSTPGFFYQPFDGQSWLYATQPYASTSIGFTARIAQWLGEDAYCVQLAQGGAGLAVTELDAANHYGNAWHDPSIQNNWAPAQSGSLYERLLDTLDAAKTAATAQGDTLQCVGVVYLQGEQDTTSVPTYTAYFEGLKTFKRLVREAIQSRSLYSGTAPTIPWVHPFIQGTYAAAQAINDAIRDAANLDSYMATFSTAGFSLSDTVHYDGPGLAQIEASGMDGLVAASTGQAGWVDVVTTETGTGSSTADSYVTEAFCDDYFSAQNLVTAWLNATAKNRQAAMRYATSWVDNHYGLQFVGLKSSSTQALEWPRSFAYDRDGYPITGIPTALKKATAEVARRWLEDATQLDPDIAAGSNVTQDTVTVGPITISKSYAGGKDAEKRVKVVDRMFQVAGLVESGGWAKR